MATLLNWSDSVFVAQERFAPLTRFHPEAFKPSLYTASRMLDFRPGECGYGAFQDKKEYASRWANPKDFMALDSYPMIGDKITHLFRRFEMFGDAHWRGLDVAVVHMIRNVFDVAASYQTRKEDAHDAWDWDGDDAVADWTESVERVHAFHQSADRTAELILVDYDWWFGGDGMRLLDSSRHLFQSLGLAFDDRQTRGIAGLLDGREHFVGRRRPHPELRSRVERSVGAAILQKHEDLRGWSLR